MSPNQTTPGKARMVQGTSKTLRAWGSLRETGVSRLLHCPEATSLMGRQGEINYSDDDGRRLWRSRDGEPSSPTDTPQPSAAGHDIILSHRDPIRARTACRPGRHANAINLKIGPLGKEPQRPWGGLGDHRRHSRGQGSWPNLTIVAGSMLTQRQNALSRREPCGAASATI